MNGFLNSKSAMIAFGVLAGGLVVLLLARQAKQAAVDAARATGDALNPTSDTNIINRGINAVGDALDDGSDNESFSLGSFLFDLFNPEFDPNAPAANMADGELRLIEMDQSR